MNPERKDLEFSSGRMEKFMLRNNFSLRRVTSKHTIPNTLIIQRVINFKKYVYKFLLNACKAKIFAFDETAIQPCSSSNTTIDNIGSSYVGIKSSNWDKYRITLIVGFNAEGLKMKPCFLQHSTTKKPCLVPGNNYFSIRSKNAWINDEVMKIYLNYIFPFSATEKRYLVIDSARPHISISTKKLLEIKNIKLIVIPGGITSLVQPADVFWFKKIKSFVKPLVDGWIARQNIEINEIEYTRPPKIDTYASWFTDALNSLTPEEIQLSFEKCFLSTNINDLVIANHEIFGKDFMIQYASEINDSIQNNYYETESDIKQIVDDLVNFWMESKQNDY